MYATAGEDASLAVAKGCPPFLRRDLGRFQSVYKKIRVRNREEGTCDAYGFGEVQDGFPGEERLPAIILNLDIDHMYELVELATSVQQICHMDFSKLILSMTWLEPTFADGIKAALFAGYNHIGGNIPGRLPFFRCSLYSSIPIQHVQDSVRGVAAWIEREVRKMSV